MGTHHQDSIHHNLAQAYPIGSIYMNASDNTNPGTLLGFGTWVAFGAGRVVVGYDPGDTDFDTVEETGGAKTHTHIAHTTGNARNGNGATAIAETSHDSANNMNPYIVVYIWKRTA